MIKRLSILVLASCLAFAACAKKENQNTLRIGLAGVQTGTDGQLGSSMIKGAQIAIDEWNAKGGVLGKQIEAVSRDDEGKPDKAVTVAQELVSLGAKAVIGHFNSGCSIPASAIYENRGVVNITPASTNPKLTEQGFKHVFRVVGRDDQQGKVAADFASSKLKVKTLAIMHDKSAYGEGIATEVKKTFEAAGGKVALFDGIGKDERDFRANLTKIKESGAEALYFGGLYAQTGPFVVQLREAGIKIPFLSGDGCIDQTFINTLSNHTDNIFLTFGPDYKNLPSAKNFLETYRKKFGPEGGYSIYGYDAVNVLLEAIAAAGTADPAKVAETLRGKTFQTALGPVAFDDKGDLKQANFIIWVVKDGSFAVY